MKISFKSSVALMALGTLALASTASAVSFNYSSNTGSTINFAGNSTFSFTTTPNSFVVTSGSAATLQGDIEGTFTIGAGASTAPVSGAGAFKIFDGLNTFSANLNWVSISQTGVLGGLNYLGSVNLTGITYAGSNADLLALKNDGAGVNTLSFQFSSTKTLDQLRDTVVSNSFSGTVASVPEGGSTLALLGAALAAITFIRRRLA